MDGIADEFRRLRELTGKSLEEIAGEAGLDFCSYCDLEWYDDEFDDAISIENIEKVCRALGTSPHELCRRMTKTSSPSEKRILADDISRAIRLQLATLGISLLQFEDEVGWELAGFLENSKLYVNWNIRCLQDVCAALKLDWIAALP